MQLFYCFLLFVNLAFCQQSNNPPFKIAITAENPTVVAESDILINVSLTNTSDHDVYEGVMYMNGVGLDSTLRFDVRDEHGKAVPTRIYPHEELRTGKAIFRTIWAGQTLTQPQPVSARYDMRKPGKYTVQVWRRNPDYEIKSNIVTITVTPKDTINGKLMGSINPQLGQGVAAKIRVGILMVMSRIVFTESGYFTIRGREGRRPSRSTALW